MSIKDARERSICQGFQRPWIFGNHRDVLAQNQVINQLFGLVA
jgi:hypothetical protein